jgi:hypothetical protein
LGKTIMYCDSCNTAFADEMKACPACGSPVVAQKAAPSAAYNLEENEIPYSEHIPFIDAVAFSTVPSTSSAEQQANNGVNMQQAMPVLTTPAQQTRSAISTGTIVALTFLILLLVIEGSGFAYYGAIVRSTDLHTQATSVARTFLTAQAQSTAFVQTQATATAAAMTPDELYKQTTSGTPVIDDPLTVPGASVFYQYGNSANGCSFKGGAYHLSLQQLPGAYCIGLGTFFENFAMQAQVTIIQGSYAGLAFCIDGNKELHYYVFVYDYSGNYGLFVVQQGQITQLKAGYSSAIVTRQSSPNLLTVIARNNHFYLYINRQSVDQVIGNTYSSGQIGFVGYRSTGAIDIAFANLKVWDL